MKAPVLLLVFVACAGDDHGDGHDNGPFTFDASAALPQLCPDGTACPLGPLPQCSDGTYCIATNAHVVSDPPGIYCGRGSDETACVHAFDAGTQLHVTTTGGGAAGCYLLSCSYTPPLTTARAVSASCDVTFAIHADTTLHFQCVNP